jgi:hypothetical protein
MISTSVSSGNYYMIKMTIQARALNASDNGRLSLSSTLKLSSAESKLQQMIIVPTQGVNSRGQIVQTLQVTGVLYAGIDFEKIDLALKDSNGKKLTSTTGVIELTKIKYQPVTSEAESNLVASKAAASKAAASKAAASKAAASKAAASKAAAAKAAAAKAAASKAAAAKAAAVKAAAAKAAAAKAAAAKAKN